RTTRPRWWRTRRSPRAWIASSPRAVRCTAWGDLTDRAANAGRPRRLRIVETAHARVRPRVAAGRRPARHRHVAVAGVAGAGGAGLAHGRGAGAARPRRPAPAAAAGAAAGRSCLDRRGLRSRALAVGAGGGGRPA